MRRIGGVRRSVAALVAVAAVGIAAPVQSAADRPTDHNVAGCVRADLGGRSVARVWDDALLELIRQVVPAPTVHARNLFHTSVAMWDAWAAYDPDADGYLVTEKAPAADDVRRRGRRRSATRPTACCCGATARCRTSRSRPSSSTP